VRYALQIAEAVAFAHSRGILHRDLKPENVIVEGDGSVKVLDFGIARAIEPASFDSMEVTAQHFHMRTGAVVGNIGYMAPEQLSGEPVDQRADIFSLGCILYEMVAHHQPFRGGSAPERMAAILTTSAAPLPAGAASPSLERTIQRCLAKEPDHRFATMNELLNELRAELPARTKIDQPTQRNHGATATPSAPGHRIWMAMAIALIALGLAGAAFALWLLTS
jgi:serine/threonine-protein kinase